MNDVISPTQNVLNNLYYKVHIFINKIVFIQRGKSGYDPYPSSIQPTKVFKELQKAIRSTERQVLTQNPPKPERESKRKKKKVMSEDFVDYTNLTSFHSALEERLPDKKVTLQKLQNLNVSFLV